jgi:hypothetical protein
MSQIITIKRMITVDDLEDVLRNYADLQVVEKHSWGVRISYVPEPDAHVVLTSGELQATSPSARLFNRLELLAKDLNGRLLHEDEEAMPDTGVQEGSVRSFSIFWPVVCAVLLILLIWRW